MSKTCFVEESLVRLCGPAAKSSVPGEHALPVISKPATDHPLDCTSVISVLSVSRSDLTGRK